jgi:hypothetical protein
MAFAPQTVGGGNGAIVEDDFRHERIATRHHLSDVNLFEPFRRHHPEKLYQSEGDDHWNAAGQQLAAALMADYVVRNRIFPSAR